MSVTIDNGARKDIALTDPIFFAEKDPDVEILRDLRRDDPVHWTEGKYDRGFWSITRHGDCRSIYERDMLFQSNPSGPMLPISMDYAAPVEGDLLALQLEGAQIASMDGPGHLVLRNAFATRLLRPSVKKLEDVIRMLVVRAFNEVLPRGECDFAVDIAGKVPLMLISHVMDLPPEIWPDIYRWTYMSTSPEDAEFSIGTPEETSRVGTVAMMEYCLHLARERREKPGEDLISDIAITKVDGEYLSDNVVGFNAISFVSAGHETTRNALCGGVAELLANDPGELARLFALRGDQTMMQRAADESVRWATPLTHQLRTAMEDSEIGGKKISAGDWVVMWNNSANRDETVFDDPYRFDGTRAKNPHLGFGYGPHFCLGTHLARLELRIMWEIMLEYMRDMELTAEPDFTPSLILRGIKHMPLRFTPRNPIKL